MRFWAIAVLFFLAACDKNEQTTPKFFATSNPERLSEWGQFSTRNGVLTLSDGVTPYDLATPLFSDYALKLRTLWLPDGEPAIYSEDGAFTFPVGTVITKTFYYPETTNGSAVLYGPAPTVSNGLMALGGLRLIETRILVHRADGWRALPYLWNEDQTEAALKRTGAIVPLTIERPGGRNEDFAYVVPNVNQCAGCHATNNTTREIEPIGLKARHLNKSSAFQAGFNQLDYWRATGMLTGDIDGETAPKNAVWNDQTFSLDARARAYLDVNCSHCHNPAGPADTSGLNLEPDAAGPALGFCKTPIAAGGGSGGRPFGIVPGEPGQSITVFRMETVDPGAMMPELGRALVHDEGVALIAEWIAAMDGGCG